MVSQQFSEAESYLNNCNPCVLEIFCSFENIINEVSHRIFISADQEVLSDSYKCKVIEGVLYEVEGKVSRPHRVSIALR